MKLNTILALIIFSSFAYSQKTETVEIVPLSEIMPVIVIQQESPIKVDDFIVTRNQDRNLETFYQVHNRSNKAIKSYTIARWYSDNSGYIGQGALPEKGAFLEPSGTWRKFSCNSVRNRSSFSFGIIRRNEPYLWLNFITGKTAGKLQPSSTSETWRKFSGSYQIC